MNPFTAALSRSKVIEGKVCAENTQKHYRSGRKRYMELYEEFFHDVEDVPLPWPPTLEGLLALFTVVSEEKDYRFGSLTNIAKAITFYCREEEIVSPTKTAKWVAFMAGLKKEMKGDQHPFRADPILIPHLDAMIDSEDMKRRPDYLQSITLFTLQFWGFLRINEILALRWLDVIIDEETKTIKIIIRHSKTDATGKGETVHIFQSPLKCHPLQYLQRWKKECTTNRLFSMTDETARERLKLFIKQIGAVGRFSTHSFRKGGAHAAALNGASDASIKTHGRWRSSIYTMYTSIQMEEAGSMIATSLNT